MAQIAFFPLDEAASGTAPTTAADTKGPNTADIDYSSGDAEWTTDGGGTGNGFDFTATSVTNASAVIELEDIVNNGDIGSSFDGVKTAHAVIRVGDLTGHSFGARVLFIGTNSGNGDFAVVMTAIGLAVRWDQESGGSGSEVTYLLPASGLSTIGVDVDTTEAVAADRITVYYDGVVEPLDSGTMPGLNVDLGNVNSTNRSLCIGNRPDGNRNINGVIYAVGLGNTVLGATAHLDAHNALAADNDANYETPVAADGSLLLINRSIANFGGMRS